MAEWDNITGAANAISWIVKEVPIYQDLVQPAAVEIGKWLWTIAKTVHIALAPVSALVWGYDKMKDFLERIVSEKLQNVSPENIQSPNLLIAWPLIEWLKYAWHDESLQNLFANLLANSMDKQTADGTHPGFVQIIQNMSPDEAKILKLFAIEKWLPIIDIHINAESWWWYRVLRRNYSNIGLSAGCNMPTLTPAYLDNLIRLWLLEIPPLVHLSDDNYYIPLEDNDEITKIKAAMIDSNTVSFQRKKIQLTSFGLQFCELCVINKA